MATQLSRSRFVPPFNPAEYDWLPVGFERTKYLRLTPRGCVTIERDDWGWTVAVRRRDEDAFAVAVGVFMSEALTIGGQWSGYERSNKLDDHPRTWGDDPPTTKQLVGLKRAGYSGAHPATKGEAWHLMSAYTLASDHVVRRSDNRHNGGKA